MNALDKIEGLGSGIKSVDVKPHLGGQQMLMEFENGFGLSILSGGLFYTEGGTYEVATLDTDGRISDMLGDTYGDGVYGYQTAEEVASIARRVSYLKAQHKALQAPQNVLQA